MMHIEFLGHRCVADNGTMRHARRGERKAQTRNFKQLQRTTGRGLMGQLEGVHPAKPFKQHEHVR